MELKNKIGNISTKTISEVIKNKEVKKLWDISKDKISICSDCEYRLVCSDRRNNTENNSLLGKSKYCSYNPYTGEWLTKE